MSKAVHAILIASAAVTNDLADGRSSVRQLSERQREQPPYLIIQSSIADPNDTNSGQDLDEYEVSIFIVSKRLYTEGAEIGAWDISENVRAALHGTTGTHGGQAVSDIKFNNQDPAQLFQNNTNEPRVQVEQNFTVWINR